MLLTRGTPSEGSSGSGDLHASSGPGTSSQQPPSWLRTQWEPGGQQWRAPRDQGRREVPRAACRPLPHLLGRLSVTRGGEGGPGGGRLLIGRPAEAGGAVQRPPGRQGGSRGGSADPRAGSTPSPSSPPLPSHLSACPADDYGLARNQLLLDVQPAWPHSCSSVQSSMRTHSSALCSATGAA